MVALWAATIGTAVWSPPRALGVINECWLQRKSTEHIELSAKGARVNQSGYPGFSRWRKGTTVNLLLTPGFTGHDKEECRKRYLELWFGFSERRTADRAVSAVWAWGVLVQMMRDCSIIKSSRFIGDQVQGRGSTMRTDLVQVIRVRRTRVSSCQGSRISRYEEFWGFFNFGAIARP